MSKLKKGDRLGRVHDYGDGDVHTDGFCGGEWGRDSYGIKTVVKVHYSNHSDDPPYVLVLDEVDKLHSVYNGNPDDLKEYRLPEIAP